MQGTPSLTIKYTIQGSDGSPRTVIWHRGASGDWQPSCTCKHGQNHFPANCYHVKKLKPSFDEDIKGYAYASNADEAYWKGYKDGFEAEDDSDWEDES